MQRDDTPYYSGLSKFLHWFMALAIATTLVIGWGFDDLNPSEMSRALQYHLIGGLLVLALLVVRIASRIGRSTESHDGVAQGWRSRAVGVAHTSLYALMFVVPVSGLIAVLAHDAQPDTLRWLQTQLISQISPDQYFELKRLVHTSLANALAGLVIIHAVAAMVHHFWLKDNVLKRMLPTMPGIGRWKLNAGNRA